MVELGVNINNREPLLTEQYPVSSMLSIAERTEELGYDSVWVGDSLLEKPRLDPVAVMGNVAARTDTVDIGTACMITALRNPIQLAQQWATLDMLSDGRMVLGACMGTTANELGRAQYEAVDIPPQERVTAFEECLEVLTMLWEEGEVNYSGDFYEFDGVSFDTGNEVVPLEPVQDSPPILIVSNPSARGNEAVYGPAIKRIVDIGDGWMTCCRADHPEEYERQWDAIASYAEESGRDPDDLDTIYNVTVHIADNVSEARENVDEYLGSYYPSNRGVSIDNWGPVGDADTIIDWITEFNDIGCDMFSLRFASFDQVEQVERFSEEVLPSFT